MVIYKEKVPYKEIQNANLVHANSTVGKPVLMICLYTMEESLVT